MLYWGLTEHKLKIRIVAYAICMHALILCSIYGSYVLYNSRVLSIGAVYAKRNAQTARRSTRVTLGKLSSLGKTPGSIIPETNSSLGQNVIVDSLPAQVLDNTKSERAQVSPVKVPVLPVKNQKAEKISEPTAVISKKIATKLDRDYTKLLRINSDKETKERVKEPPVLYSKIKKDKIVEKKIEPVVEKIKQVSETQAPKPVETITQKIVDKPKIMDHVIPGIVPINTSSSSDEDHDLVISSGDDAIAQELIAWEQELVLQVAHQLVLPAGFADREPITITVYVDLTGVPDIRNEMGCTIPALRAIVRKFFKNFAYPVHMRGKQRTFVIL
jgi:hypothetical protein